MIKKNNDTEGFKTFTQRKRTDHTVEKVKMKTCNTCFDEFPLSDFIVETASGLILKQRTCLRCRTNALHKISANHQRQHDQPQHY